MGSVDASDYLKDLQSKSAARFPKEIIRQKGRKKIKENLMIFFSFTFFFNLTKKFSKGAEIQVGRF